MAASPSNIGYASLQVIPVVRDIEKNTGSQISGPIGKAGEAAGKAAGAGIVKGITDSKAAVEKASAAVAASRKKEEDAAGKVRVAEAQLQSLRERGITDAGRITAATERIAAARRNEAAAADKTRASTTALETATRAAATANTNLSRTATQASRDVASVGQAGDTANGGLSRFGATALAGAGLAILASKAMDVIGFIREIGETFEGVRSKIELSTGASTEAVEGLTESVKNVAKGSPAAIGVIADRMTILYQRTGLTGKSLEDLTKQVNKAGGAIGEDLDLRTITKSMAAFGVTGDQMGNTLDDMFRVARNTGVGMNELASSVIRAAPSLQEFGFSLSDSVSLVGNLDKAGIDATSVLQTFGKGLVNIAKDGQSPQQAFKDITGQIQGLIDTGNSTEAINVASNIFGTKGAVQFVNAVKSGQLSMESLTGQAAIQGSSIMDATGATVTFAKVWGLFKNNVIIALEPLATKFFGVFIEGLTWLKTNGIIVIQALVGAFQSLADGGIGELFSKIWSGAVALLTEVEGGIRAFVAAFQDGSDEVTSSGLAGFLESLGVRARNMADVFVQDVVPVLQTVAGVIADVGAVAVPILVDGITGLFNVLNTIMGVVTSVSSFFVEHKDILLAVVGVITALFLPALITTAASMIATGGATLIVGTAMGAYTIATNIAAVATKAFTVAQNLLKIAFLGNPIGLIVAALVALVAGIVIAYKHSDSFRAIVDKLWSGIKTGAAVVWDFLQPIFAGFVDAFKMIGTAAMFLLHNVIEPVFTGIKFAVALWWAGVQIYWELLKLAWKVIETSAMFLWHNVIEPVFEGIKFAISLWWAGVQIYWELLKLAWEGISAAAMWLWHNAIEPAFNGIGAAISFMWNTIVSPIFNLFKTGFDTIGNAASWLWNEAIVPAFDGIKSAISTVWDLVKPILDNIGTGISGIGTIATTVGDTIKTAFDGVVDILKTPIHAIGGLLAKIPESILGVDIPGAKTLKSWGETLQKLRSGGVVGAGRSKDGVLWGPGDGTSDSILGVDKFGLPTALVSNKEGVVTAEAMENGGAAVVASLNKGGGLPKFAAGGVVGEPYGLENYSDPFPAWVQEMASKYNLDPSTYAGHQETDRAEAGYAPNPGHLNRGIDWSGGAGDMARFAGDLLGMAPDLEALEQVIFQDPSSGEKYGWYGRTRDDGSYYADNYGGHTDHVHTRQSASLLGGASAKAPKVYKTDSPDYVPPNYKDTPDGSVTGGTGSESKTRLKSFKELGSDMGGILAEGLGESLGLPDWIMDPAGYLDSHTDKGDNVRTTYQDENSEGTASPVSPTPETDPAPAAPPAPNRTGADLYSYEIARAALDKGMGRAAAVIGEATGLVEAGDPLQMWANSNLPESLNLPHDAVGSNGTSTGLFQQQDYPEWGPLDSRMDPYRSAGVFYDHFPSGWENMAPGDVAQAVQRSAFPGKYADAMPRAEELVNSANLFDTGGIWEPGTWGYNDLSEPELVLKKHQWGVLDRQTQAVENLVASGRGGTDNRMAEVVNIQGYTMEEVATEWRAAQWNRTAGYGTSRNR